MLMEEDDASGDIFRCLVGNLPPGTEAVIKFAYVIELQLSPEGAVLFVLPTQLNPRYNPSEEGLFFCSVLMCDVIVYCQPVQFWINYDLLLELLMLCLSCIMYSKHQNLVLG